MLKIIRLDPQETQARIQAVKLCMALFLSMSLVTIIVMMVFTEDMADNLIEQYKNVTAPDDKMPPEEIDKLKPELARAMYVGFALVMFVQLIFLWGILREIQCLVLTYAILSTMALVSSIFTFFIRPYISVSLVTNFILTFLAYYLSYLISLKRASEHIIATAYVYA